MSVNELIVTVTDANFGTEVLEESLPVLVDFWAEWCGPCRMISPLVDEVAEQYRSRIKVCKVNVDDAAEVAKNYGVMSIPTLAIFKDGAVVDKLVGAVPKTSIVSKIEAHL